MADIATRATIGEDRVLRLQLPGEFPTGEVDVLVTIRSRRSRLSPEQRRAAASAGHGALKYLGGSVDEFLAERREDDSRRDKALGI